MANNSEEALSIDSIFNTATQAYKAIERWQKQQGFAVSKRRSYKDASNITTSITVQCHQSRSYRQ